jgi:CBS domain-containing protein
MPLMETAMTHCRDIMTREPICVSQEDTVQRAAQLMQEHDIGPIPVVDDTRGGRLLGIVTDRDLTLKVVAPGRPPARTRVGDVMTRSPVTCRPEDDVDRATAAMEEHQVRRIPIVDGESGTLVGIIAQADVATRVKDPRTVAEVVERISRPAGAR